jgi:hypothetical protein
MAEPLTAEELANIKGWLGDPLAVKLARRTTVERLVATVEALTAERDNEQSLREMESDRAGRLLAERDVARAAADQWETRHNRLTAAIDDLLADAADDHVIHAGDLMALLDVDTGHTGDDQ